MSLLNERIILERERCQLYDLIKELHAARSLEYRNQVALVDRGLDLFRDSRELEISSEYFFKRSRIEWLIKVEQESEELKNSLILDGTISRKTANKCVFIFRDGLGYATADEKEWLRKERDWDSVSKEMYSRHARWGREAAQRRQTPMFNMFISDCAGAIKGATRAICGAIRR